MVLVLGDGAISEIGFVVPRYHEPTKVMNNET